MNEFMIRLNSVDEINSFIRLANLCPCDVHISTGNKTCNAKAYMGVFSLDFDDPLLVTVEGTAEQCDSLRQSIAPFVVEPEPNEKG